MLSAAPTTGKHEKTNMSPPLSVTSVIRHLRYPNVGPLKRIVQSNWGKHESSVVFGRYHSSAPIAMSLYKDLLLFCSWLYTWYFNSDFNSDFTANYTSLRSRLKCVLLALCDLQIPNQMDLLYSIRLETGLLVQLRINQIKIFTFSPYTHHKWALPLHTRPVLMCDSHDETYHL